MKARLDAYKELWLSTHLKHVGPLKALSMLTTVWRIGPDVFGSVVQGRLPLSAVPDAVALQETQGSDGKVLVVP